MTTTLEARLRAMEDIAAIANLKARYINACDGGWNRPRHSATSSCFERHRDDRALMIEHR